MTPTAISLIISLVEEAIKEYPAIAADLQSIFGKANPTPDDWSLLRAKVLVKSYEDYVPATAIPATPTAP